jgi:hypothetical protein
MAAAKSRAQARGLVPDGVKLSATQQVPTNQIIDAGTPDAANVAVWQRKLAPGADSQADAVPPIVVRKLASGGYQVLDGADQLAAAQRHGFDQVPVIIAHGSGGPPAVQGPKPRAGTKQIYAPPARAHTPGAVYDAGEILNYVKSINTGDVDAEATRQLLGGHDYELREVPTDDVGKVFGAQSIDHGRAIAFAKQKTKAPPIVLNEDMRPIDGKHRFVAAKARGDKTILAYVPVPAGTKAARAAAAPAEVTPPSVKAETPPGDKAPSPGTPGEGGGEPRSIAEASYKDLRRAAEHFGVDATNRAELVKELTTIEQRVRDEQGRGDDWSLLDDVAEPPAGGENDHELRALLKRYTETGDLTVADLVEEVDALGDDRLKDAVDAHRREQQDDRELAGRNDMDAADERFVMEVERVARGKSTTIAPPAGDASTPKTGNPKDFPKGARVKGYGAVYEVVEPDKRGMAKLRNLQTGELEDYNAYNNAGFVEWREPYIDVDRATRAQLVEFIKQHGTPGAGEDPLSDADFEGSSQNELKEHAAQLIDFGTLNKLTMVPSAWDFEKVFPPLQQRDPEWLARAQIEHPDDADEIGSISREVLNDLANYYGIAADARAMLTAGKSNKTGRPLTAKQITGLKGSLADALRNVEQQGDAYEDGFGEVARREIDAVARRMSGYTPDSKGGAHGPTEEGSGQPASGGDVQASKPDAEEDNEESPAADEGRLTNEPRASSPALGAGELDAPPASDAPPGAPASKDPARATKFRDLADRMQSAIDNNLNPATAGQNPTPRRARIIDGMRAEGERLQRIQFVLRKLADAYDAGDVPDALAGVRTRSDVELVKGWNRLPSYTLHASTLRDVARALAGKQGGNSLAQWFSGVATSAKVVENNYLDVLAHKGAAEKVDRAIKLLAKSPSTSDEARRLRDAGKARRAMESLGIDTPAKLDAAHRAIDRWQAGERAGPSKVELDIKKLEREALFKKIPGYFPTPPNVADRVVILAEIGPADTVLEPSAGNGNLVDAVRRAHGPGVAVTAIEANYELRKILDMKGIRLASVHDFTELPESVKFDVIVMNPPFEKGADIAHVMKAWKHLNAGGRLVAIMGEGAFHRTDGKAVAFRAFAAEHADDADGDKLPAGTFEKSGTGVASRIIVFRAPADVDRVLEDPKPVLPAPGPSLPPPPEHPAPPPPAPAPKGRRADLMAYLTGDRRPAGKPLWEYSWSELKDAGFTSKRSGAQWNWFAPDGADMGFTSSTPAAPIGSESKALEKLREFIEWRAIQSRVYTPLPPRDMARGNALTIETAAGEKIPAAWAIMESDDLIPSHDASTFRPNPLYPPDVQERDYQNSKDEQAKVYRNEADFNPDFVLTDNPDPVNGGPMILGNGRVMGGNSRAMVVQRVYGLREGAPPNGTRAESLRSRVIERAPFFGIEKEQAAPVQEARARARAPGRDERAAADARARALAPEGTHAGDERRDGRREPRADPARQPAHAGAPRIDPRRRRLDPRGDGGAEQDPPPARLAGQQPGPHVAGIRALLRRRHRPAERGRQAAGRADPASRRRAEGRPVRLAAADDRQQDHRQPLRARVPQGEGCPSGTWARPDHRRAARLLPMGRGEKPPIDAFLRARTPTASADGARCRWRRRR